MSINTTSKDDVIKAHRMFADSAKRKPDIDAMRELENRRLESEIMAEGDDYYDQLFKEVAA